MGDVRRRSASFYEALPGALHSMMTYLVPFLTTLLLASLLAVRFDPTPAPPCRRGASPDDVHTICGFPEWNPRNLGALCALYEGLLPFSLCVCRARSLTALLLLQCTSPPGMWLWS